MEFLKEIALPQSLGHYQLLLFVLNMVSIVLMPYLGFLLGVSLLGWWFDRRGRGSGSAADLQVASDLLNLGLFRTSLVVFAALIPALVLVFVYAQMLQHTPSIAVGLMGYAFLALLAASVLLSSYRVTFAVGTLLRSYGTLLQGRKASPETAMVDSYSAITARTHVRSGRWGIIFLTLSILLTLGATTAAVDPTRWGTYDTVFDLLLSVQFYARIALFLGVAAAATGIGVLFFAFRAEQDLLGGESSQRELLRRTGILLANVAVLAIPLLILVNILLLPPMALSGGLFALAASAIVLVFIAGIFVYAYGRDNQSRYTAYAVYALLLGLTLLFTTDQVAIATATRDHSVKLAALHAKQTDALKARLGVGAKALTGKEIYEGKCSACHLFDQRKVGPPYKDVIPKYEGKKGELVAFILNPVKVNPGYPSMPGQGLKPAEADSIASFLLQRFAPEAPPAAAAPTPEGGAH
jgi:cytochrome c551/c552